MGLDNANLQETFIDGLGNTAGVSQSELDLLSAGLRSERGHDHEIHVTDHVVGENQKIGGMQIGVKDAEPEGVIQEVGNDVGAEDRRDEAFGLQLVELGMVVAFEHAKVGGHAGAVEILHGQDALAG